MNDERPSEVQLRDFVYLDIERVRSFVAQLSGGLVGELAEKQERKTVEKGGIDGGVPAVFKLAGGVDHHYVKTSSETRSLHDAIFAELIAGLESYAKILDLSNVDRSEWREETFTDGEFVLTRGVVKILDYPTLANSVENLPKIQELAMRLSKANPKQGRNSPAIHAIPKNATSDMASIVRQSLETTYASKFILSTTTSPVLLVGSRSVRHSDIHQPCCFLHMVWRSMQIGHACSK